MADDPQDELNAGRARFFCRLGQILVTWNRCEVWARNMVQMLAGGNMRIWVLTVEINAVSLCDALNTLTNDFAPEPVRPHLDHFRRYFDTMRVYRNYYAHGIINVGTFGDGSPPPGILQAFTAKGGALRVSDELVQLDRLSWILAECERLDEYGVKVIGLLGSYEPTPDFREQAERLEKPPLPAGLSKPREGLISQGR